MTVLFDILKDFQNICDNHGVSIEINSMCIIIRKYFYHNGKPYNFNQAFSFEIFNHAGMDFCISEFERRLRIHKEDLQ